MSQCHDLYDTVWPASKRRAVPVVTQCRDLNEAPVATGDDQPAARVRVGAASPPV
jgi:hypothetical protein